MAFKQNLLIFLFERFATEKEGWERSSICWLTPHLFRGCADTKPGTRSLIQVSYKGEGHKYLDHSLLLFQDLRRELDYK